MVGSAFAGVCVQDAYFVHVYLFQVIPACPQEAVKGINQIEKT